MAEVLMDILELITITTHIIDLFTLVITRMNIYIGKENPQMTNGY